MECRAEEPTRHLPIFSVLGLGNHSKGACDYVMFMAGQFVVLLFDLPEVLPVQGHETKETEKRGAH